MIALLLLSSNSLAFEMGEAISELPIDTAEEASVEISRFMRETSCLAEEWQKEIVEKEDRWVITLAELKPLSGVPTCPTWVLTVCKKNADLFTQYAPTIHCPP